MERGEGSQDSDWLLAEKSGVQIPSEARDVILSRTVQTMAGAHQLPV